MSIARYEFYDNIGSMYELCSYYDSGFIMDELCSYIALSWSLQPGGSLGDEVTVVMMCKTRAEANDVTEW